MRKFEFNVVINLDDDVKDSEVHSIVKEIQDIAWDYDVSTYQPNVRVNSVFDSKVEQPKIRGFKVVSPNMRKTTEEVILPTRSTKKAMAYDFYANDNYIVEPNQTVKIWTDVKAYMREDEGLILNIRSSMGGKFMLANTQGWIDSDYYSNESNDGNIGIFLINISDSPIEILRGARVAQGMFINFLVADNGNTDNERVGGFGSSGK